jgi:hypothetical protein
MADQGTPPEKVRMTLLRDNFISEYGGRLPAGTAIPVDTATADRWREHGIATDSKKTDKTLYEQKQAELSRLSAEMEELASHGAAEPAEEEPTPTTSRRGTARS